MHVKLAHLMVQTPDSVSREGGIDLVEDRARCVLYDKAVLQDISVQGWGWEELQPANLLRHERREAAYIAKTPALPEIEHEAKIRTKHPHASLECSHTWQ